MMNDKMNGVVLCLLKTIPEIFPDHLLRFSLSGIIDINDLIMAVLFECTKHAYDTNQPKYSIRHFLQKYDMTDDDDRMKYSRLQSYVMKYRQREYDYRMKSTDPDDERSIERLKELIPPDMSTVEGKLEGYKISEMNFYEITKISELLFCKSFTEKRLMNTNSVPNPTFIEYCQKFDETICELHSRFARSDEETVFFI